MSLIVDLFPISTVLASRHAIRFRVSGYCMLPCLRHGDLLTVDPRALMDITVGDIAVFRRRGRLFAHRVIATGRLDDRPYVITRPDTAVQDDDGFLFDDDVLGIVASAERNGRSLSLLPRPLSTAVRRLIKCLLAGSRLCEVVWFGILTGVQRGQESAGYRWSIGRWIAAGKQRQLTCTVQVPLHPGATTLYRDYPLESLDPGMLPHIPGARWTVSLTFDSRPVASLMVKRDAADAASWWVESLVVRMRYRGAGFDARALSIAEALLSRLGATRLRLAIPVIGARRLGFIMAADDPAIWAKALQQGGDHD